MNKTSSLLVAVVATVGLGVMGQVAAPGGAATAPAAAATAASATKAAATQSTVLRLEQLNLGNMTQEWGDPQKAKSVNGNPLTIAGTPYKNGVGTHANSRLAIDLKGLARQFVATVGVDDETGGAGSVTFRVTVDGKVAASTGVLKGKQKPQELNVDLTGAKQLVLEVTDGGDDINSDHADWADAAIILAAAPTGPADKPASVPGPAIAEEPVQIAHGDPKEPAIHGPKVVGTTPGRPFLFLIPATGEGPLTYTATDLPGGLTLDAKTGILTGSVEKAGEYPVSLTVTSALGKATSRLKIVAGAHKLAQTPPLGWNSWNVWARAVDDAKVRAAADAMASSGLARKGFTFVNIDDCWEGKRDASGEILANEKFPDMKGLTDYVHAKGLKIGLYSSPGPKTCAGFEASYQHEDQDAKTWAKWGFDYIKYDWCSYSKVATGSGVEQAKKPYVVLRQALDKCDRDIVYSLCQYGRESVWQWGAEPDVAGNLWRTTGDIRDTWSSMASIGFGQAGKEKFAGPGHWNDPDMLVVGKVGWGPRVKPTALTQNEQLTHISLWCLLAAPLLIGCDMSQMDPFTLDLLTNSEVIAVDQDELGKQAARVSQTSIPEPGGETRPGGKTMPGGEVWAKPMADGTLAVGLFNRSAQPATVVAKWSDLGLNGAQPVRDLWQKKDLGNFETQFEAKVPRHGVVLVKVGKPKG